MKPLQSLFLIILFLAVITRVLFAFLFPPVLHNGQQVSFTTTLLTEPIAYGKYDSITAFYSNGWSSSPLRIYVKSGSGLHYGDTIDIVGTVQVSKIQPGTSQNASLFTSTTSTKKATVPANEKVMSAIYFPNFVKDPTKQNPLLALSFILREKIQLLYEKSFSSRLASLLLGIVLGVRGNFPKNFLNALQATGVMHVIAASGMNVAMVSGFFLGMLGLVFRRQWAILLTVAILLFYCVVSGLQSSILRATIMIGLALIGQLVGRQYSGLYGLLIAACGMLLYNPLWVADIGFQLSFASTLGIFFLKPLLPQIGFITDDIGTTIAAQLATLPILLGSFGSYGILSILVNALVLWTIPPLMVIGGIGGLVGLLSEPLGKVILLSCLPLLWFFEQVILFFGGLKWQISLPNFPMVMAVGYYLMLGSMVVLLRKKRNVTSPNDMRKDPNKTALVIQDGKKGV